METSTALVGSISDATCTHQCVAGIQYCLAYGKYNVMAKCARNELQPKSIPSRSVFKKKLLFELQTRFATTSCVVEWRQMRYFI